MWHWISENYVGQKDNDRTEHKVEISYQIEQIKHLKQYRVSEIIHGVDIRLRFKFKNTKK